MNAGTARMPGGTFRPARIYRLMTRELANYIADIRSELRSKIEMLAPLPDMTALEARRAQNLADECKRLDAAIEQFELQNSSPGDRRRVA